MKKIYKILFIAGGIFALSSCNSLPNEISQDKWLSCKKYVKLSTGIKMAYVEMGDKNGEPIILQHGMTDNSRSWSLAAPYFAEKGYHVYLPDLRGMGKSDDPDGIYTPITYATDLEAFFDAKKIDKAIVVGHSLGSLTAQTFSLMFPERCNKVVLVSSAAMKNYLNTAIMTIYKWYVEPLKDDEHPSSEFMDFWYTNSLKEEEFKDVYDSFLNYMKKEAQALSKKAWTNICLGFTCNDYSALYSQIDYSIPVLLLHGEVDNMALGIYQQELRDLFKIGDDSYKEYADVGHNIQFEIPHQSSNDILYWLENGKLN